MDDTEPRVMRLEVDGNHYKGYLNNILYIDVVDEVGYRDHMIKQYPMIHVNQAASTFDDFSFDRSGTTIGDACNCSDMLCTE